jgi:hypothetical protein
MANEKKQIAIRQMETYQTDDARRIESWKRVAFTDFNPTGESSPEQEAMIAEMNEVEFLFIGVVSVSVSESVPPREIRFRIKANNLTEAFSRYNELAQKAAEEYERQFMEFIKSQQNKIVTASSVPPIDDEDPGSKLIIP